MVDARPRAGAPFSEGHNRQPCRSTCLHDQSLAGSAQLRIRYSSTAGIRVPAATRNARAGSRRFYRSSRCGRLSAIARLKGSGWIRSTNVLSASPNSSWRRQDRISCQSRSFLVISGSEHGIIRRKAPFAAVLIWAHLMLVPQMPLSDLNRRPSSRHVSNWYVSDCASGTAGLIAAFVNNGRSCLRSATAR